VKQSNHSIGEFQNFYKAVKTESNHVLNDKINSQANALFETMIKLGEECNQLTTQSRDLG
jgi:hypothetical protein